MTASIIIRTDLLAAVASWTSDDQGLGHLRVVLFKNNKLVACDGHRLVQVPIACNGLTIAIDRDLVAAAAAAQSFCKHTAHSDKDYGWRAVKISVDDKQAVFDVGKFTLRGPLGDPTTFPAYEGVIPTDRPERHPDGYGFDPKYLAAIHEVQVAAGATKGMQGVKVTGWSADGLGAMLFEGHMGIRYVVMPVRV